MCSIALPCSLISFHASPGGFHRNQNNQQHNSPSSSSSPSSSNTAHLPPLTTSNFNSSSAPSPPRDHLSKLIPFLGSTDILKNIGTISAGLGLLYHGFTFINNILSRKRTQCGAGGRGGVGGGGKGAKRGGGGGGGGGDNYFSLFSTPKAMAKEEESLSESKEWDSHGLPANIVVQLNQLSGFKKYKVSNIFLYDEAQRSPVSDKGPSLMDMVSLEPQGIYSKAQLQKELESLSNLGVFDKLDFQGITQPDGTIGIKISFKETAWESPNSLRCINVGLMRPRESEQPVEMDADMTEKEKIDYLRRQNNQRRRRIEAARQCMLPVEVQQEVFEMVRDRGKVTWGVLQKISRRVEEWYHENGFTAARAVNFDGLGSKELVLEVVEGDITRLVIQFHDKLGNVCQGKTQPALVRRELPHLVRPGQAFNTEAVRHALRNLMSLGLFSNVQYNPMPDDKTEGGLILNMNLNESDQKSAEASLEWNIVPGRGKSPIMLASLQPGGTISFQHRNLKGLNRSINGSISSSNLFDPNDAEFQVEYVHPYIDGVRKNSRNRTFRASCFNTKKRSPVFTGGSPTDEVPPTWVDRVGIKANVTEKFSRQSTSTYGMVIEEIKTRDNSGDVCMRAPRLLANGEISADGPPTTLGGTGVDRMAFLQANITRDNTKFVNGAIVGERDVFQVDQGVGIGTNFPFFNRHKLNVTRFIQLKQVEEGAGKPRPPVLVLRGQYSGCVGDLPPYEAFSIGGPHSVRGYNMGEIGAARHMLELGAEIRMPVRNTHAYAFVEHGNDLGSSSDVNGNPTKVYRRVGRGSSYGVGINLASVRLEFAIDNCSGAGAIHIQAGERF